VLDFNFDIYPSTSPQIQQLYPFIVW
jgi:hypothetical protein